MISFFAPNITNFFETFRQAIDDFGIHLEFTSFIEAHIALDLNFFSWQTPSNFSRLPPVLQSKARRY